MRTLFTIYPRGLLDLYDNMPELSTNRMIPFSRVNKFFYELVWTTTFEYSYWDQMSGIRLGYAQGKSFIKTVPFVFDKTMLKSRGIEPVDRFLITGPLCQKQHKFVKNLMLDNFEFLLSSVGTGLQRSFTFPNLQFLTTLAISLEFVKCSARNHLKIEQKFPEYWMSQHCSFNDTGIELPPFVEVELNQKTTDQTVINEKIFTYYEILICRAIAKMISRLDHPVDCKVIVRSFTTYKDLKIILWCFAKEDIINQVGFLQIYFCSKYVKCEELEALLKLLNLDRLCLVHYNEKSVTQDLAPLLIENNSRLHMVHCLDPSVLHVNFPDGIENLRIGSNSIFSDLNIPLSQRFIKLVELGIDFCFQIDQKYIAHKYLHLPTLKTLRVSKMVSENIGLICCFLNFNPTVTTFAIYQNGRYENLEPIYRYLSNVKVLDISYRTQFQLPHILKFSIESLLDIILRNASSLEMILIHKSKETEPVSFGTLAAKLACEHEQNTKYLRYLYIYNDRGDVNELGERNLVPKFFESDRTKLSPYNPVVKKLYNIDSVMAGDQIDAGRCRLEIDVRKVRKFMTGFY